MHKHKEDEIDANHRERHEQKIQYHKQNQPDNDNNNNNVASLPGKHQQATGNNELKQHVAASQFVRRQSIRRKKPTTATPAATVPPTAATTTTTPTTTTTTSCARLGANLEVATEATCDQARRPQSHQKPPEIAANSNEIIPHHSSIKQEKLKRAKQQAYIANEITDKSNKSNSGERAQEWSSQAIENENHHQHQNEHLKAQQVHGRQAQKKEQAQPKQQVASRLSLLLLGLFDRTSNRQQNQTKSRANNDIDNVQSEAHRRQQQQQQHRDEPRSATTATKSQTRSSSSSSSNKQDNPATIRHLLNNNPYSKHKDAHSHTASGNRRSHQQPANKLTTLRQLTAAIMLLGLACLCLASLSANLILLTSGQQVVNPNKLLTSRHNKLAAANRGLDAAAASIAAGGSSPAGSSYSTSTTSSTSTSLTSSSSAASSIPGSKEGKLLVCYYTNWSQYRPKEGKYVPEDIDPHLCTHVIVAFGWMKKNRLAPFDASDESKDGKKGLFERVTSLKLANPALKVLVAVGGWSFGTERFKTMAVNRYNRQLFIFSALEFLRERNFDGLDIDWEFPQASDKKNFVDLLKELREAFDAEAKEKRLPKLMLTVAVSAGAETVRAGYDVAAIGAHVDFINIMSYDFHGKWESKTGHNAPLFASSGESEWRKMLSMDYGVKLWERMGAPKSKLVVGLATYGRSFTLASTTQTGMNAPTSGGGKAGEFTREGGFLAFYEICDMLKQGASYYWDEEQAVPYAVQGDQWVGFDDELSIRNKVKWLNDQGYAGAMVWALDMDDFKGLCTPKKYPLIKAMAEGLFGLPVRPSQEWRVIIEAARTRANVAAGTSIAGKVVPGGAPSTAAALAAANSILSSAGITNPATADAIRSVIVALGPTALTAGSQPNADLAGHLKNIPGLNVTNLLSSPSALAALTSANPQLAAQIALAAAAAAAASQQPSASNINLGQTTNLNNNNRSLDSTNARIVCYYTNWSYKRPGSGRFGPENLDPNLCTHIIYAFYGLKDSKLVPTEEIDSSDNDQAPYKRLIALKQLNPNLKVMLAVGGWMMGYAPFRQLTENAYRQTFFTFEVIEFLRKKNFDGLDLCWEFPRGLDDKEKFSNLVKELRESFDGEAKSSGKPRLILSAAVPASFEAISAGYDVPTINKYLDFMNVMTYDFHGDWEQVVGHNSPLYPLNSATPYQKKLTLDFSAAEWVRQGASKENLVIGLPTYGRTFTLANPNLTDIDAPAARGGKPGQYTKESGFLSFFEVCEMLKNQATLVWDNEQMIPYAYKADQWVGFDDPRSFKMKVQWLKQNGYSGIMIWSVDMDDFAGSCMGLRYPLIKSAKEELKGYYVPNLVESAQGSTMHASIGTKDELQCEETDGHITYHKDKKDCTMYYMCEGSRKHHMPCPQNLVFNQNENVCDWPENVEGCGTKVATETSAAPAG